MRTHGQHGCYVLLDRLQRILTNQVTEPSWRERGAGGGGTNNECSNNGVTGVTREIAIKTGIASGNFHIVYKQYK